MLPPYYRGCWHGVSRSFLWRYRQFPQAGCSSLLTDLYIPKNFIGHAAWLRQAFAHCARFLTAASRRSLGRISVPVWLIILSDQLTIVALVSRYLTNELMVRKLIPKRPKAFIPSSCGDGAVCGISPPFGGLFPTPGQITYVLLTRSPLYRGIRRPPFAYDLHVLGPPPAFVLSQDQTLHCRDMHKNFKPRQTSESFSCTHVVKDQIA